MDERNPQHRENDDNIEVAIEILTCLQLTLCNGDGSPLDPSAQTGVMRQLQDAKQLMQP